MPVLSHLRGFGPCWFWTRTLSAISKGGRFFVPWLNLSTSHICLLRIASSLILAVSLHVSWGTYRPGNIGMKSRMSLLNRAIAGDIFVSGSLVFLYCNIALWNLSVFSSPHFPVLSMIILFTVFAQTSALQLL